MHASFSNERAWKARRENARTGTISDDEDGGRGRGRDPVAAPQLALILVNPRLSNLHPFVLRSGRQAARLSPRFTTGIFRVSSQGTGWRGEGRGSKAGKRRLEPEFPRQFYSRLSILPVPAPSRERERERRRGVATYRSTRRKISASGNERCIGGLEIEIARQDVNDLGKKRKETRGRGKIERNGKSGIRETRGGTVGGKGRH